ncbi:MAG: HAD-superfamily hydrolase, subfamily variant 3 [Anaerocolumna sp.]|jgi:HAD superfamily hydrolase (TIGR01509 family)|nr:HAD-superfamily hydrolase, subfamily variant 3 [Anaerocolumna sp.]
MLKAVIFDMDGVLVDSEPLHARAHVLSLRELGIDIPLEYCYQFIGSTTIHMLNTMIKDFNLVYSANELLDFYNETKKKLIAKEGYEAVPFTKELIIDLYRKGIKLAIASSSTMEEISNVVTALGISQYFTKLISGTTVPNPKPAPDVFLKAVYELDVKPDECIIIEDSYNGVCAANSANIPVIGYINEHSGQQDLTKANFLIEGFEEVNYIFINNVYQRFFNLPITVTTTTHFVIRELTTKDIPDLYRIYQNPNVKKYVEELGVNLEDSIEKHKAYIEKVYHFYGYGLWGVFIKDSNELVGHCGIQNRLINNSNEIEIGYLFDERIWGRGYAYECCKAILDYAFKELEIKQIIAVIDPQNERSIHLAERLSMKKVEEFTSSDHSFFLYKITNNL